MAPDVIEGLRNPNRHALKKGPWTTSEDLLLLEYVRKHGEGNWNAVQRNSGLLRCGKSCRLRWANHLRPHLKKGAFSPDEERLIVELHAKMGNKWARMASQLPGRTDNEIKNYWNTRLKRRQRAGLPIYPHEVVEQEQRQRQIASAASLYHRHNTNPMIAFAPAPPAPENIPANHHQLKLYHDGIALALDAASSSLYSASTFFNQLPPMMNSISLNQFAFAGGAHGIGGLGLPSIQSPPATAAVTPAASSSDFAAAEEEFEAERGSLSGLLEDLFGESRALVAGNNGNGNMHEEEEDNFGFSHGGSSSHGSYEGVEGKSLEEGMTSMDDELMNLLDNFPLSVPIPDWNGEEGSESPNLTNGTSSMMHSPSMASEYNPVAASSGSPNQEWNFGSCLWNNMSSIY